MRGMSISVYEMRTLLFFLNDLGGNYENGPKKRITISTQISKKIEKMFPEALVYITDGNYIQGFPDIIILFKKRWAALECKRSRESHHQPLQDYYISKMNVMSFARFVYPENEEEVLNDLQQTFKS